jgi:hypothetical protein
LLTSLLGGVILCWDYHRRHWPETLLRVRVTLDGTDPAGGWSFTVDDRDHGRAGQGCGHSQGWGDGNPGGAVSSPQADRRGQITDRHGMLLPGVPFRLGGIEG